MTRRDQLALKASQAEETGRGRGRGKGRGRGRGRGKADPGEDENGDENEEMPPNLPDAAPEDEPKKKRATPSADVQPKAKARSGSSGKKAKDAKVDLEKNMAPLPEEPDKKNPPNEEEANIQPKRRRLRKLEVEPELPPPVETENAAAPSGEGKKKREKKETAKAKAASTNDLKKATDEKKQDEKTPRPKRAARKAGQESLDLRSLTHLNEFADPEVILNAAIDFTKAVDLSAELPELKTQCLELMKEYKNLWGVTTVEYWSRPAVSVQTTTNFPLPSSAYFSFTKGERSHAERLAISLGLAAQFAARIYGFNLLIYFKFEGFFIMCSSMLSIGGASIFVLNFDMDSKLEGTAGEHLTEGGS